LLLLLRFRSMAWWPWRERDVLAGGHGDGT
jgi:hypothetical protein